MGNTVRTETELLHIFRDHKIGGITAQDIRDFLVSIPGLSLNSGEGDATLVSLTVEETLELTGTVSLGGDEGEAGQVLTSGGPGEPCTWEDVAVSSVTPNRVVISNGSGVLTASNITATELNYLDGVTGFVQVQLGNKAAASHTHTTLSNDLTIEGTIRADDSILGGCVLVSGSVTGTLYVDTIVVADEGNSSTIAYTLPTVDGTANQVLTCHGDGTTTWGNPVEVPGNPNEVLFSDNGELGASPVTVDTDGNLGAVNITAQSLSIMTDGSVTSITADSTHGYINFEETIMFQFQASGEVVFTNFVSPVATLTDVGGNYPGDGSLLFSGADGIGWATTAKFDGSGITAEQINVTDGGSNTVEFSIDGEDRLRIQKATGFIQLQSSGSDFLIESSGNLTLRANDANKTVTVVGWSGQVQDIFDVQDGNSASLFTINYAGAIETAGTSGSAGQVLTSAGNDSPPTWEDASGLSFGDNITDTIFNSVLVTDGSGNLAEGPGWDGASLNLLNQDLNNVTTVNAVTVVADAIQLNNGFTLETDGSISASNGFGDAGQILTSGGTGVAVSWENPGNPFDQDLNQLDTPMFDGLTIGGLTITHPASVTTLEDNAGLALLCNIGVVINDYRLPLSDGADGYVMTAHADGTATWEAPTGSVNVYREAFIDPSSTISVTHGLGQAYVQVTIYDENDKVIIPDEIEPFDTNTVTIDISSYGAITGTWNVVVVG